MKFPHGLMVLKLLAILPSGSAGKFLEKNLEFVKNGGRGSEFCFRTTTPHKVPSAKFVKKSILSLLSQGLQPAIFRRHFSDILATF